MTKKIPLSMYSISRATHACHVPFTGLAIDLDLDLDLELVMKIRTSLWSQPQPDDLFQSMTAFTMYSSHSSKVTTGTPSSLPSWPPSSLLSSHP
jgi:hypothetical protein